MNIQQFSTAFRDRDLVLKVIAEIKRLVTRPWTIMEICGGQTHAIIHYGLDQLLPQQIELVHGPGCPVCVTSLELVDKALDIASRPEVIFCSYGDMLRVPGSATDLFSIKAQDGDVRVVYSALDAVQLAKENPEKQVVFFGIGFETTAPPNAMSILQARGLGLKNYSVLASQVCVPPAVEAILGSPSSRVQGFLLAGHVCAVMGYQQYPPLAAKYGVPMSVTGFEPLDLVTGILNVVEMLETGVVEVTNSYSRLVREEGNREAQKIIYEVFEVADRNWRGIGTIPASGWGIKPELADFDAEKRFDVASIRTKESEVCIAGEIMQGLKKPFECPAFGTLCTPSNPLGAPMVSAEGACAAYHRYARHRQEETTIGR
ncbi:MAG TPA: hydrogenase formation protein HypD [Bellilinea sp.]|nr:hydrogenase formation protein HypD [Bellilinea sp.]